MSKMGQIRRLGLSRWARCTAVGNYIDQLRRPLYTWKCTAVSSSATLLTPILGPHAGSVSFRLKVRIENPTPGGARFTSAAKARFYELQGCAKLSTDGKRLRFLESHYRKQSAELSAREIADQGYRLSAGGYDGRGILTLDEIAKIPVVRPAVLVTTPKKARSQPRRNG